jgi:putative colanic acid biosynthesis UDP-glucose lipid carrier transferase
VETLFDSQRQIHLQASLYQKIKINLCPLSNQNKRIAFEMRLIKYNQIQKMTFYSITKRGIDILVSSIIILFVLSWLIPIIGILVKLDSRGPVFFTQSRDGKDKDPFFCIKFRSMRPNWTAHLIQAKADDERVTRFGWFLRKSHIDELPQFINVFLGEMSLIGPRPHMHRDTNYYGRLIEKYDDRLEVKPGFTGLAQINDLCGNTGHLQEMRDRVRIDRFYVKHQSIGMELMIVVESAHVAVRKVGSFFKGAGFKTTYRSNRSRRLGKRSLKRVA